MAATHCTIVLRRRIGEKSVENMTNKFVPPREVFSSLTAMALLKVQDSMSTPERAGSSLPPSLDGIPVERRASISSGLVELARARESFALESATERAPLCALHDLGDPAHSMDLSGVKVVACARGRITVLQLKSTPESHGFEVLATIEGPNLGVPLTCHVDLGPQLAVTCNEQGVLTVWNLLSGECVPALSPPCAAALHLSPICPALALAHLHNLFQPCYQGEAA